MHEISVIISNFNGAKYLPRLIETLAGQQGVRLEVIVVDRNSRDDSLAILAGHPDIRVVQHPPETGLVCGYVEGMKSASHDLLFFSNEDMWFEPDCLLRCAEALLSDEKVAAVMPTQLTYDGKELVNCGIWFTKAGWNRGMPYPFRRSSYHRISRTVQVSYANAGACLVRRRAYEEVGGWDVSFFLDDEDTDIGIRFWQAGWKCLSVPEAVLGHAVGASNTQMIPNLGSVVGRKRYVCALSNFLAVSLKSFSASHVPLSLMCWLDRTLRDLLKGRFDRVGLDFAALALTLRRLPELLEHRRIHAGWIAARPGEGFYRAAEFDAEKIRDNRWCES